jgi:hypothetical protein
MLTYVSLLSPGFSGSTLASMLLSSQPGVIGFGDTYFSGRNKPGNPCTCGEPYTDCPVRSTITRHAREQGLADFSFFDMRAVPTPRALSDERQRKWPLRRSAVLPAVRAMPGFLRHRLFPRFYRETELMLEALDGLGEYEVYFDGCKNLVRLELLRSSPRPPRALHMIRHPGAYLFHFQRHGETDLDRRLRGWLHYHSRARQFRERLGPENYRLVTYENIVSEPARFLNEIAAFIGSSRISATEPVELRHEGVHVMGNSMRLKSSRVVNMGDRWRGKLDPAWKRKACDLVASMDWLADLFPEKPAA